MTRLGMRTVVAACLVVTAGPLAAQRQAVTQADSMLVARVLMAEQRGDRADPALTTGATHANPRIRTLALRASARLADSLFATRDSLPPVPLPVAWPEPDWKPRYRALTPRVTDCAVFRAAVGDSAWPVRLRAADAVPVECAGDEVLMSTLRRWIDNMPSNTARRSATGVSWHAAAHAVVALARLRAPDALVQMHRAASHSDWHMRSYALRAARVLTDTSVLRRAVRDPHPNVREAAIEGLAAMTGHTFDLLYMEHLGDSAVQVVRAAATALQGSPLPGALPAADAAHARWAKRDNASERDARLALLAAAGRPASDERPLAVMPVLAPGAVALALGSDVRLRVSMAASNGGGTFVVRLRGDVAPIMAARIMQLADSGYYNGGTWHRVEPDFVIQGAAHGDNEYVGNARYLRDELGTVPHARGTVGMSTRGHDSGDAQWFINLRDNLRLNRDYTVFAEVVEGMSVVDGILEGDAIATVARVR